MTTDSAARSAPPEADPSVAEMPFEQAMAELEGIVNRLERGDVKLEESIQLYERGGRLKARCEALLARIEARIETISLGADGAPSGLQPLDPDRN
jgi:exodeoxyribonuclease VII small subunit